MRMEKRKFRIGELAKRLGIERFVIRFWEKEFAISTTRSTGKQRFYSEDDYDQFKRIKELLYKEGFTIAGAKKQLILEAGSNKVLASKRTTFDNEPQETQQQVDELTLQIKVLKKKLVKLRELL